VRFSRIAFAGIGPLPGEPPTRIIDQSQLSHSLGNHGSLAIGCQHKESRKPLSGPLPPGYMSSFNAIPPSANSRLGRMSVLGAAINYSPTFSQGNSAILALVIGLVAAVQ